MRTNIELNTKRFAFLDSSCFKTSERCKTCIATPALPDRTPNSSCYFASLVNTTLSTCFNDTTPTCKVLWTGFLEKWSTLVLEALIFIPAMSHAVAKLFNACRRSDLEEDNKTKSSAKSNKQSSLTYLAYSDCYTHIGSTELVYAVHANYEKEM